MTLQDLDPHQIGIVQKLQREQVDPGFITRLEAMGIIPGQTVRILRSAPFGGPLQVRVGSTTEIAIRRHEANLVIVSPEFI